MRLTMLAAATLPLAACGQKGPEVTNRIVYVPQNAAVAPGDAGTMELDAFEAALDERVVSRVQLRSGSSVTVSFCDGRQLVLLAPPAKAQQAMLARAYRPGCR